MPTEYSHSAPYKGTEGGEFNIKPLLEGHCDCGVYNDISYIPPFSNYIWNDNACFRTTVTKTFNTKPLYLSHHWGGPGVYELDVTFVTKQKFYGDDISSSFDFYSENNELLHLCCINNYKITKQFPSNYAEGDRPPNNLSGIDYIIVDTSLLAPSYLFDWNSEHLSGVGSSLDDWPADKAPQYGVSFWQGNSSYRPTNVQQFIRYDQGKSIDSAVEFDVNDHMLSSTSSPALVRNSTESEVHFINSGFISLMVVAEPTSGNEDNNLISFFSDSYTSGSGFSLQAISGTSHSGNISLSGTHNQTYYFSYDNVEPGPSIYSLSINNQSQSFALAINGQYITGGSATIPYEGYYQIGSGFEGKIYQVVGISKFNDYPRSEIMGMLAENWGNSNKLPTGNPYRQPKLYGVHILDLSGNFDIEGIQSSYQSGNLARFSISPKRGIQFSGLSGDPGLSLDSISQDFESVDNITRSFPKHQLSILVTGDMILDSYYTDLPEYNLEISGSGDHQGAGTYFSGETIAISTSTSHQQKFVEWESGVVNDPYNPNTEITLTGNINLNAKYRNFNNYNVFLQGIGQQSGAGIYLEDSTVSITGYPPIHKNFDSWQVTSGSPLTTIEQDFHYTESFFDPSAPFGQGDIITKYNLNSNPNKFIITGDIELTANYVDIRYNINTRALYDNGLISGINGSNYFDPTGQTYLAFDSVQLTGIADSGYDFVHWQTGDDNYYSGEILNLTITGDYDITAVFESVFDFKYQNYTGLFSGGYISGTETGVYPSRSGVSFSVVTESGFEFDQWLFNPSIESAVSYTGSGYTNPINFLQSVVNVDRVNNIFSEKINRFNLPIFSMNYLRIYEAGGHDETYSSLSGVPGIIMPIKLGGFRALNEVYTQYTELFTYNTSPYQDVVLGGFGNVLGHRGAYKPVDFSESQFSLNDTYILGQEKTIEYSFVNQYRTKYSTIEAPDSDIAPINTVYNYSRDGFEILSEERQQVSTNWCLISGEALNPDNKILTFKCSVKSYKLLDSEPTHDNLSPYFRLELFPCKMSEPPPDKFYNENVTVLSDFEGYERADGESYSLYESSYYESSIRDRSFRGAYFDTENSRLHKGKKAPEGFSYKYEMCKTYEDPEYIYHDISVSVIAENEHAQAYALIFQPFYPSEAKNDAKGQIRFKFAVNNLFLGQLPSKKIHNFDLNFKRSINNVHLSHDFDATLFFKKVNNTNYQDFSYNLVYTPELRRDDLQIQDSRLFMFGNYQTEAPVPNSFEPNEQYKLGLNLPAGHRFSRYRAIGKGIRTDVGFFELTDQTLSLDSLFEPNFKKITSNIEPEDYAIGTPEFYEKFGYQWSDQIEEIKPQDYMLPYLRAGSSNLEVKDPNHLRRYPYYLTREDARFRHYYIMHNHDIVKQLMREEGSDKDLMTEMYAEIARVYDNWPIIDSWEIEGPEIGGYASFSSRSTNEPALILSVKWTPVKYYQFKSISAFNNFENYFAREYEFEKTSRRAFVGDRNPANRYYIGGAYRQIPFKADFRSVFGPSAMMYHNGRPDFARYEIVLKDYRMTREQYMKIHENDPSAPYKAFATRVYASYGAIQPMAEGDLANSAIRIVSKQIDSNAFYYKPNQSLTHFDCKLLQSNIKENALAQIFQCQKVDGRGIKNIEWTSMDAELLSDATFRFRPVSLLFGAKNIYKIYRLLVNNDEKYIGQMTCLDAVKGEFIINWDGDLSAANITTNNFHRSANNFSISQGFSLTKIPFKNKFKNSFFSVEDRAVNIKPLNIADKFENFTATIGTNYKSDAKEIENLNIKSGERNYLNIKFAKNRYSYSAASISKWAIHPIAARRISGTFYYPNEYQFLSNDYEGFYLKIASDQWKGLKISLISIQEYMQDFFSQLPLQQNRTKAHWKTSPQPKLRVNYNSFTQRIRYSLSDGDEIYPGIVIDYMKSNHDFSFDFQNQKINIPTLDPELISTNVSKIEDVITSPISLARPIVIIHGQIMGTEKSRSNMNFYFRGSATNRNSQTNTDYTHVFDGYSTELKNNFIFTQPDISFKEEHLTLLDNIATSCSMLDITNSYNKLSRAHWSEATPSSVLDNANENFTNVTFGDDDIHLEIIYDE